MIKYYLAKSFRIPRRFRMSFYTLFNRFVFWINGVQFGTNMKVFNRIYLSIYAKSKITIGDNFLFTSGEGFNPLCRNMRGCICTQFPESEIMIGNNVGMSSTCMWAKESIMIGNNVLVGGDCIIMDTDCNNLDCQIRLSKAMDEQGFELDGHSAKSAPIVIGDDVLIGARSIILKGVTIGARSIIGAGSVVTKSIPADCIAGGNPCKVIRMR